MSVFPRKEKNYRIGKLVDFCFYFLSYFPCFKYQNYSLLKEENIMRNFKKELEFTAMIWVAVMLAVVFSKWILSLNLSCVEQLLQCM